MAFYQLPKIIGKDNKPPFGARINRHHPLSQGLVGAWLFNEGGGKTAIIDCINGMNGVLGQYASWLSTSDGLALHANLDTYAPVQIPHNPLQNPTTLTAFARFIVANVADGPDMVSKSDNSGYRMRIFPDGRIFFYDRGGTNVFASTLTLNANQLSSAAIEGNPSNLKIYVNGKYDGAGGTAFGGYTSTNYLWFGSYSNAAASINGNIYCVYLYSRALTPQEHFSLHVNPYQMFLPVVWDAYFVPAAAPPPTGGKSIFGYDSIFHAGGIIQT